jgi:hypothetical protein
VETSRTLITTTAVAFGALAAILALWASVDTEACAASDLELAHCQAAVDAP